MTLRCSGPKPPRCLGLPAPCATMAPGAPGKPAGAMPSAPCSKVLEAPRSDFSGQADPGGPTRHLQRPAKPGSRRGRPGIIHTSLYLPEPPYEGLREAAFRERGCLGDPDRQNQMKSPWRGLSWPSGSGDGEIERHGLVIRGYWYLRRLKAATSGRSSLNHSPFARRSANRRCQ
jgi:hypothetical protein